MKIEVVSDEIEKFKVDDKVYVKLYACCQYNKKLILNLKIQNMKETINLKKKAVEIYTCSMHPEVRSEKSGNCPKCGMDLVVKK